MSNSDYTRLEFLQTITHATIGSLGLASILPSKLIAGESEADLFKNIPENAVILFQGDSITDAGRNREDLQPNTPSGLGNGYAFIASAVLLNEFSVLDLHCYNRGISGNKVFQLADRWQDDCLKLTPDILSILVGVNDFWHTLDLDYDGTVKTYDNDLRALLTQTRESLPDVQLIIGEPFALRDGSAINEYWYPEFPKYQQAAKAIARDFNTAFIPYQSIFDKASEKVSAAYWSGDGVHLTTAGCQLMAQAWLETIKRI